MAQKATIHRVNIDLSDTDRQVYEEIRISVARADSETPQRLVARLLAYCVCYERDIEFTAGVGSGDEPDVWVKEPGGRVKLWLEVGLPDPKRLVKAARHCQRVALLAYGRRLPDWRQESLPLFEGLDNVTIMAFEDPFITALVGTLDRAINWSLTVSGGALYLHSGREDFTSTLQPVLGAWPLE